VDELPHRTVTKRILFGVIPAAAFAFWLGGTAPGAAQPAADLSVSVSDAPDPVSVGSKVTYTITVRNAGPSIAREMVLTLSGPPSRRLVGTIRKGGKAVVRVVARPAAIGSLPVNIRVTAKTRDPRRRNNSAVETTRVIGLDTVQGHGVRPVFGSPVGSVSVDLDARSAHDGSDPAGTFNTRYPNGDPDLRGRVVCLAVSGNKAMVGGIVESVSGSNPNASPVGSGVLFAVTDNGGRDTELTFLVLTFQGCGVQDAIPELPLSEGDFSVHDEEP
jgi:Domain of unknown function DUF11